MGVLDFLNFVPIHSRLHQVSHSNTMAVLKSTRYKTAKIGTIEHTREYRVEHSSKISKVLIDAEGKDDFIALKDDVSVKN